MQKEIKISLEDYCKLCDVLSISPESSIDDMINKINILNKLLIEYRKKAGQLKTGE